MFRAQVAILGSLAAGWAIGYGQKSSAEFPSSRYLAYRTPEPVSLDRWQTLARSASSIGIKPIETAELQREGILVFEKPKDDRLGKRVDKIFSGLTPLPVREYRGVLSVSSGYFYLQFQTQVPIDEVRKRLSNAGFKIVTPDPTPDTLMVVKGSRLPLDRERELTELKKLPEILYVAPHDIPLPHQSQDQ